MNNITVYIPPTLRTTHFETVSQQIGHSYVCVYGPQKLPPKYAHKYKSITRQQFICEDQWDYCIGTKIRHVIPLCCLCTMALTPNNSL